MLYSGNASIVFKELMIFRISLGPAERVSEKACIISELWRSKNNAENSLGIEHNSLSQDLELVAEEEPALMSAKAVMPG